MLQQIITTCCPWILAFEIPWYKVIQTIKETLVYDGSKMSIC